MSPQEGSQQPPFNESASSSSLRTRSLAFLAPARRLPTDIGWRLDYWMYKIAACCSNAGALCWWSWICVASLHLAEKVNWNSHRRRTKQKDESDERWPEFLDHLRSKCAKLRSELRKGFNIHLVSRATQFSWNSTQWIPMTLSKELAASRTGGSAPDGLGSSGEIHNNNAGHSLGEHLESLHSWLGSLGSHGHL